MGKILEKINWMILFNILMIANFIINIHQVYAEICSNIHMSKTSYIGYGLSEFLINWKGGYVRRGLIGELLYRLCEVTAWQPVPIIIAICIISYVAFAVIFFVMLKKEHISWWIMFLPFTLGSMQVIRKDHICFLVVLLLLYLLKRTFRHLWVKLFCIYVVSCFLLHIHEAFFFVIVPFIVFYLYFYEFSAWSNKFVKIALSVIPLVIPFLLICHYHGDENTARIIHTSWVDLSPSLAKYQFTSGDSIGAIGWTTIGTIKFHLHRNFHTHFHNPFILLFVYYLAGRFLVTFNNKSSNIAQKQSGLNVILLFQFIMLLPLFSVLSYDIDRICMYWTVSSFCIYCIFKTEISQILSNHKAIFNTAKKFDSFYDSILKPTKGLLCFLILFITIPQIGTEHSVSSVRNGFVLYAKKVLHKTIK